MKKLALILAAATLTLSAQAQGYAELGYTSVNYGETVLGYNLKASPSVTRVILGYEVQPTFSIEGMLGFGLGDSSVSGVGNLNGLKVKIDNLFGIYAKPKYQFSPNLEGFLRVGVANGSGTASYNGISSSSSGGSLSAGVGMSYAIDKKLSVNVDAMSYYNKGSTNATGMTVGLGYKF